MENTLPKLLKKNFMRYGDNKTAMRVKHNGIWKKYSWQDYYTKVKMLSLGLVSLGFKKGNKITILGENKPEWFWAELAAQAAGGTSVGVYPDCNPSEVKYFIEHSDSVFAVVHDQEQVDKLLEIKSQLINLRHVIYWDNKGLWNYNDPFLIPLEELLKRGHDYDQNHPDHFADLIEKGSGDDICVICYTSGTSGLPKGALLSHNCLINNTRAWYDVDKWQDSEQYVSFIPPSWITEQCLGITGQLIAGMEVNFPENAETVQDNIRDIGPHLLFYGPRLWENINHTIQGKIADTTLLRRFAYKQMLKIGYRQAAATQDKKQLNAFWKILGIVADRLVFRYLRDKVGLARIRNAYTAGAAVSPDILNYFQAIGVNIKQFYGGSEAGLVTMQRNDDIKWETSGTVLPGVNIKLSQDGEILVNGNSIFSGYYKNPTATQKVMLNGWYQTGDFGHLDENGHLIVIDRMDDLKKLQDGRKFSPQYIEVRLRFCQYIKDALIVGNHGYVTALININFDNVGRWAESRRIPYTTFTDLSQKKEVIDLIKQYILDVNKSLPEWMRVKKTVNLHKEFDADEAELTRTRKIRRVYVEEKYADLIEALYGSQTDFNITSQISYRDGKTGEVETKIQIADLSEENQ